MTVTEIVVVAAETGLGEQRGRPYHGLRKAVDRKDLSSKAYESPGSCADSHARDLGVVVVDA